MEEQSNETVVIDYSDQLSDIMEYSELLYAEQNEIHQALVVQNEKLEVANTYLGYVSGFLLFFVAVTLCVFAYKFIRLFI